MIELFDDRPFSTSRVNLPGQWPYLQRISEQNLKRYREGLRYSAMTTNAKHYLVDILNSHGVSMRLAVQDYVYAIQDRTPYLAMSLGLTGESSPGKARPSAFYGRNTAEIVILNCESFDVVQACANWTTIDPVKVLCHPISCQKFPMPDSIESPDQDFSVIHVDVAKLALQYRCFMEDQTETADRRTVENYLVRYVWPGMMKTHMEQVWFNRIINSAFYQNNQESSVRPIQFVMQDCESGLNVAKDQVTQRLRNLGVVNLHTALENIPSIFYNNSKEALALPEMPLTPNLIWVTYLSRLKHLNAILVLGDDKFRQASRDITVRMLRQIQYGNVAHYMEMALSGAHLTRASLQLQQFLKLI